MTRLQTYQETLPLKPGLYLRPTDGRSKRSAAEGRKVS